MKSATPAALDRRGALSETLGREAVIARLSGDEFAVALALDAGRHGRGVEQWPKPCCTRSPGRSMIDERMIQVGAFAGIAVGAGGRRARCRTSCAAPTSRMDHAEAAASARPVWFDAGMERALIAHSEIEQGIRFGLEHDQFVPFFEPQVDLETGEIVGFEVLARWITR